MITVLYYEFIFLPNSQTLMEKYFHFDEKVLQLRDIIKNTSIIFENTHHSFEYSKPESSKIIKLAGLHLTQPEPLPEVIVITFSR